MVDLSIFNSYLEPVDNFMKNYVKHEINNGTIEAFLNYTLAALDCSRVWENGMRPAQTISTIYRNELTQYVYAVQTYVTDETDQDKYLTKVIDLHNKNLEYEKLNPPIVYEDKKFDKPVSCKAPKHKSVIEKEKAKQTNAKEKKVTIAEKKLIAHVGKIDKLTIKLK